MLKEALWKGMHNMEINKNIIEVELGKLYAIWLREFKVFLREKSRLVASIFTPLMWLFVIGSGLGSAVSNPSALSTAGEVGSEIDYQQFIFPGVICMSVIFSSVFFGSVIILLLSFALTSLGLTLGSYVESLEGFQLIVSFVVFPLFFLSGALFPLNN